MSGPTVLCVDADADRRADTASALSGSVVEATSVADARSTLDTRASTPW